MNADLKATLDELGPEYQAMVTTIKAAYEPQRLMWMKPAAFLSAASLVAVLAIGYVFNTPKAAVIAKPPASEFLLAHVKSDEAVNEILRTQRPDGGWDNDFLTKQNAAALRSRSDVASQLAFKKAMRNLRMRGML